MQIWSENQCGIWVGLVEQMIGESPPNTIHEIRMRKAKVKGRRYYNKNAMVIAQDLFPENINADEYAVFCRVLERARQGGFVAIPYISRIYVSILLSPWIEWWSERTPLRVSGELLEETRTSLFPEHKLLVVVVTSRKDPIHIVRAIPEKDPMVEYRIAVKSIVTKQAICTRPWSWRDFGAASRRIQRDETELLAPGGAGELVQGVEQREDQAWIGSEAGILDEGGVGRRRNGEWDWKQRPRQQDPRQGREEIEDSHLVLCNNRVWDLPSPIPKQSINGVESGLDF